MAAKRIRRLSLWDLPSWVRRGLLPLATLLLTLLVACIFSRRFFFGPTDWLVGIGLLGLCVFGHFGCLLWMIGFAAWRSRPREHFPEAERITTRTALVMPIYHEDVAAWKPASAPRGGA